MSKKKKAKRDSIEPKRDKNRKKLAAIPSRKAAPARGKVTPKPTLKKDAPLKTKAQIKKPEKSAKSDKKSVKKSDKSGRNEKVRANSARMPAVAPAPKAASTVHVERKSTTVSARSAPVKITKELLEIRARLQTMLGEMRRDIDHEVRGASERDLAHINDTSDMASDAAEGDLALRIAESETVEAEEIERSIEKIDNGTYGICEMCNKAIGVERLKFLPYVTLCIKCQELAEIRRREDGDELDDLAEGAETDNDA